MLCCACPPALPYTSCPTRTCPTRICPPKLALEDLPSVEGACMTIMQVKEKASAMMFIELMFWKPAAVAQAVRDDYGWRVRPAVLPCLPASLSIKVCLPCYSLPCNSLQSHSLPFDRVLRYCFTSSRFVDPVHQWPNSSFTYCDRTAQVQLQSSSSSVPYVAC